MTKNGQNYHKMDKNYPKWPKMTQNIPNCLKCLGKWPNEARNTNTKLPDIKWRKIAKKKYPKIGKMTLKWPKITQNGPKCLGKWSK